jgi:hypothetical protein
MRLVDPPTIDTPTREQPEDVDGLLRAFFRSEMPEPWPAMPVPEETPAVLPLPMPARKSLFRSRLALVASVAFLLVGPWLLSGSFKELTIDRSRAGSGAASKNVHLGDPSFELQPDGTIKVQMHGRPVPRKPVDDMNNLLP